MPPLSVITLALLGGFVFVSLWHVTKIPILRSDGYRLVFYAAIAGAFFLFIASILSNAALQTDFGQNTRELWYSNVKLKYSGIPAIAFLIGVSLWLPLNLLGNIVAFLSEKAAQNRAILNKGDTLEIFLRFAMGTERPICVTVNNGKVYVGELLRNFNPAFPVESIGLLLQFGGYRIGDTQQLKLDLDYEKIHEQIIEKQKQEIAKEVQEKLKENPEANVDALIKAARIESEKKLDKQIYNVVIRLAEVRSMSFFDKNTYDEHVKQI